MKTLSIPYSSDKTTETLQQIVFDTVFLSHIVQIKLAYQLQLETYAIHFLSHIVQIKPFNLKLERNKHSGKYLCFFQGIWNTLQSPRRWGLFASILR